MAVKASAQITMTDVTDIDSTCRYYLLQSSTLSKPSKPTTNPPASSWTKTEPSYTAGSTNSLYFTDLTVYSNGEFSYSDVSLSSSYEAAKAAYNKAVEAAKTATNYIDYSSSGGLQVGNKTSGSWAGFRTQITSSAFNILNAAGETLASYGAKLVELGKNASDAVIKFCNGKGQIGINVENELELSSDRIRMSSVADSMCSSNMSSHVNRESDGYYINPSIGTSCHFDSTGTYSSKANGYAGMSVKVTKEQNNGVSIMTFANVEIYASENGSRVSIYGDEILVNGENLDSKFNERIEMENQIINIINDIRGYSLNEYQVGYWINGKPLYRKTISCGALPNNGTTRVYHGIDAIETLVDISGTATDGTTVLPLPCVATAALANNINVYVHKAVGGQINIQTGINRSSYTESYVTLLYTKVQD